MRFKERRPIGASVVVLCAVCVSGCNVVLTNQSPYWRESASNGMYPLTLNVEEGSGANVTAVEARVNGQWHPMTRSGQTWTYSHAQATPTGLKVAHRVRYRYASLLMIPTQGENWLPNGGELEVPILHEDADSDADGKRDRDDNCIFHGNPDQILGPTFLATNGISRIGAVCDALSTDLGHITVSQPGAQNVVRMRDNTGNRMITENNHNYHAFRTLVTSIGLITDLRVDGVASAALTVELSNCQLVYQDRPYGKLGMFIEVYGADGTHPCTFAIKREDTPLLTGSEVLITVNTDVNSAIPASLRRARMYGRVTLKAPPSDSPDARAIYAALTAHSPVGYAYFYNPNLTSIVDTMGQVGPDVQGTYTGVTYFVFRP